jgi:hypothetical protein
MGHLIFAWCNRPMATLPVLMTTDQNGAFCPQPSLSATAGGIRIARRAGK